MKPKLLVVTSTFPRWQSDTDPPFVYELSRRLTDTYAVTVHTPHYAGARVDEQMDGMQVHRFRYFLAPFERLAGGQGIVPKLRRNKLYFLLLPFFLTSQFFSLLWLVFRLRPDVIHAHWLIPQGLLAVIAKKLFGVPVMVTAHGADVFSLRSPLCIALKRWIVNNADRLVTVSSALSEVLITDTRTTSRPDIIPMGVDASLFAPEKNNRNIRATYGINGPLLLFVGRLTEKKGVRHLLDAMPMVIQAIPCVKLLIIGHGELEGELRQRVRELGVERAVIFAGGMANGHLPSYYATADIFIGPSVQGKDGDTEGFGLTFVEAMMSGCLVIGTRTGGIEDIIEDGVTGYLVPPGDDSALAVTITHAALALDRHSHMRHRARQAVMARFDWNSISARYCNAYPPTS